MMVAAFVSRSGSALGFRHAFPLYSLFTGSDVVRLQTTTLISHIVHTCKRTYIFTRA